MDTIIGGENMIVSSYSTIVGGSNMIIIGSSYSTTCNHSTTYNPPAEFLIDKDEEDLLWISSNFSDQHLIELSDEIIVLPNFIKPEICQKIREVIDQRRTKEPTPKLPMRSGNEFYNESQYNQYAGSVLEEAIKEKIIPTYYQDRNHKIWKYSDISMDHNWAIYEKGQGFGAHFDTPTKSSFYRSETKFTCRIYLNEDFEGGELIFYEPPSSTSTPLPIDVESLVETHRIRPETGTAVFFDVNLPHKSTDIQTNSKYWLGFEIRYIPLDVDVVREYKYDFNTASKENIEFNDMIRDAAYFIGEKNNCMDNEEAWHQAKKDILFQFSSEAHHRLILQPILHQMYDEYICDQILDHYIHEIRSINTTTTSAVISSRGCHG